MALTEEQVSETKVGGDRFPYLEAGVHTAKLARFSLFEGRDGDDFCAVDWEIVESTKYPPGTMVSRPRNLTFNKKTKSSPGLAEIKALVAALMNASANDVTLAVLKHAAGVEQPFAGAVVKIQADQIITKGGNPFTKCSYRKAA